MVSVGRVLSSALGTGYVTKFGLCVSLLRGGSLVSVAFRSKEERSHHDYHWSFIHKNISQINKEFWYRYVINYGCCCIPKTAAKLSSAQFSNTTDRGSHPRVLLCSPRACWRHQRMSMLCGKKVCVIHVISMMHMSIRPSSHAWWGRLMDHSITRLDCLPPLAQQSAVHCPRKK